MTRLAAGRARALGLPTRGTTAPGRLRRVDRWLLEVGSSVLCRPTSPPVVVDLGYGASTVTTLELARALRSVRADLQVVGVENDRARVLSAQRAAEPGVFFAHGGFDLAGARPVLVRAMNVLRQYDEGAVADAWSQMRAGLAPDGLVVEGTCDELGRRGAWVTLDGSGPRWLTLSTHLASLTAPSDLAPRLPKALIHHNVPGEPVHAFFAAADAAWASAAPLVPFGPRQRWIAMASALRDSGWPVRGGVRRWRLGELTVKWAAFTR